MSYIRFSIVGVDDVLRILKGLPAEVVSNKGGPVKLSLMKGARIFKEEEKKKLEQAIHGKQEDYSTGLLVKNIVVKRGRAPSLGKGERVVVKIRKKVYAGRRDSKPVNTLKTAQIFEYGSEKQKARPFIRPAFNAKKDQVVTVVIDDLVRRINLIVKRLGK